MSRTSSTCRLDLWRDVIRDHFVALDIAADEHDEFTGTVSSTDIGQLNVARVESVAQRFTCTPELVRAADESYLQVGLLTRGTALVEQDGREAVLTQGDFAIYETERPFHWQMHYDWELLVFTWPRAVIALPDSDTAQFTARCLSGVGGLGDIVGAMLRSLVANPPQLSTDGGVRLGAEVAELVMTVAGERAAPAPAANHVLRDIDRYILDNLGDAHLNPTTIAEAHFISTRHLHRLFAGRGNTVAGQIQQQRLERARLDLRHPGYSDRSITEIAGRWGFADLAGFSRAFRAAYGVTPTRFRAGHLGPSDGSSRTTMKQPAPAIRRTGRDPRLPSGQYDAADDWPVRTIEAPPVLNPRRWTLTIDGLVRRALTWTWDDLQQMPQSCYDGDIHAATTWSKLGTRFGGVSLDLLLEAAEPLPHGAFVLATSTTGYTTNLPLAHLTGGRAWVVFTSDGAPLPREHGGPARLLVPHLYLWKSAKWISRLTLLEHDQPGQNERGGYHELGDPWREQRFSTD